MKNGDGASLSGLSGRLANAAPRRFRCSRGLGRGLRVEALLFLCFAAVGAAACRGDGEGAEGLHPVQERDSAGIRIVENASPPEGSRLGWRIGPEPSVSIGQREGEDPYLLHLALDAHRLPDGRIVVAHRSSDELRVFDSSGTHVASWGREGEGPGEFLRGHLAAVEPWQGDSNQGDRRRLHPGQEGGRAGRGVDPAVAAREVGGVGGQLPRPTPHGGERAPSARGRYPETGHIFRPVI